MHIFINVLQPLSQEHSSVSPQPPLPSPMSQTVSYSATEPGEGIQRHKGELSDVAILGST